MSSARTIPIIFIPDERQNNKELQHVYLERSHSQIDILWYHWPKDGIFNVPDYEPIIFIYSTDGELKLVSTRKAWDFEPEEPSNLHDPIEIVFGGIGGPLENMTAGFHHPYFHYNGLDSNFNKQKSGKIPWNYQITPISSPGVIPPVGRVGKDHPSLFLKKGRTSDIDPLDWAKAKLAEL